MTTVTLKGNPVQLAGSLPTVGQKAPDFELTSQKLDSHTLASFAGKTKVVTINPSIDTGVCATTLRTFNKRAAEHPGVVILAVSADSPFALRRFCGAEGIEAAVALSTLRDPGFAERWGVRIADGNMRNLCARAVVVLDRADTVVYTELVAEISTEPNYDAALAAVAKVAG